ncbi:unnamed protein product [Candidula unifasciata]|uniref:Autophagy-related protein 13 n=1 Tax=Candidula unifasciata TaxID=100452 RepID=A0A8S3YZ30_9EUPU|nr:unnamed protein product [Candidula unifasciata]
MATGSVSSLEASGSSSGSSRDENIDRLFKNFTFKCLQVIVQSRIENQTLKLTRESSLADYFCITIADNPSIDEQIKKALEGVRSFPVKDQSICVEIPLVTNDGDHMYLEAWDLSFNLSSLDMSASKIQHVFTRMGVTLKSLLSATRAMPAYRLAKNQGEKDGGYRLTYRFYLGKPQTHLLGEGYKTVRAGSVPTAHGLFSITVSFRTQLLLSPDMASSPAAAIEMNDNYFVKEYRHASVAALVSDPQSCSPSHKYQMTRSDSPSHCVNSSHLLEKGEVEAAGDGALWMQNSAFIMEELPEPVVGAFSIQKPSHRKMDFEMPFEGLMKRSILARQEMQTGARGSHVNDWDQDSDVEGSWEDEKIRGKPRGKSEEDKENYPSRSPDVTRQQNMSVEDEFVMVDKPPFAADDDPRDVKSFLSVMFRPANLYDMPGGKISVTDYLNDVEAFVSKLEKGMPELDEFCESVISAHSREEDESHSLFS